MCSFTKMFEIKDNDLMADKLTLTEFNKKYILAWQDDCPICVQTRFYTAEDCHVHFRA